MGFRLLHVERVAAMKGRQPPCPRWAVKALQGVSYWMGYRRSLYADHPLPEAAMVAETCNLIHANLRDDETLVCERLYRTLLPARGWPAAYGPQARIDLLVLSDHPKQPTADEDLSKTSFIAIEVKRATAQRALIDKDLQRLAHLKAALPKQRAMLFVFSEASRPRRFVGPNGVRSKEKHQIPKSPAYYRVLRARKATELFSGKDTAHYSCILEVFLK